MANEEHKHEHDGECFEECEDTCAPVTRQRRNENATIILIIALAAAAIAGTFALFATGIIILDQDKDIVKGPPGQNGTQGPAGPAGPQGPPGNDNDEPEEECPDRERDGRTQSEKGANKDASTWKIVPMEDKEFKGEFKIVDDKGINVADKFNNEENAQKYIDNKLCIQAQK